LNHQINHITFKHNKKMEKSLNKVLFRGYILSSIDSTSYEIETTTQQEKIDFIISTFEKEYWYKTNQLYYKNNKQLAFANWLMGLPSSINIDFEWYRIDELGIEFGLLDVNSKESDKTRWRNSFFMRVANEIFRMSTK